MQDLAEVKSKLQEETMQHSTNTRGEPVATSLDMHEATALGSAEVDSTGKSYLPRQAEEPPANQIEATSGLMTANERRTSTSAVSVAGSIVLAATNEGNQSVAAVTTRAPAGATHALEEQAVDSQQIATHLRELQTRAMGTQAKFVEDPREQTPEPEPEQEPEQEQELVQLQPHPMLELQPRSQLEIGPEPELELPLTATAPVASSLDASVVSPSQLVHQTAGISPVQRGGASAFAPFTQRTLQMPQLVEAEKREALLEKELEAATMKLVSVREAHEHAIHGRTEAMQACVDAQTRASQLEHELKSQAAVSEDARLEALKAELRVLRRQLSASRRAAAAATAAIASRSNYGNPSISMKRQALSKGANQAQKLQAHQSAAPQVGLRTQAKVRHPRVKKRPENSKIPASLPPGWVSGRLDDGTPFYYHEHDAQHVVFSVPEAAAPHTTAAAPKKRQHRGAAANKLKSGARDLSSAVHPTSATSTEVADEARKVLLAYFCKHSPEQANEERVAEVIAEFQLNSNFRSNWAEPMYTKLMQEHGEDPRDVRAAAQATSATNEEEDVRLVQSASSLLHPIAQDHS
jgi:hypothetical protein